MARFLTYHNNILSPYRKITSSLKYGCCHCLKSSMLTGITIPWNRESQLAIWILNFWALPEIKKNMFFQQSWLYTSITNSTSTSQNFWVKLCTSWIWNGNIPSLLVICSGICYWYLYQMSKKMIWPPYTDFWCLRNSHTCPFVVCKKLYYCTQRAREDKKENITELCL